MSTLADQQARQEREETARALRALLATPFVTAEHDEATFDIIRRRHARLAEWFERHCGWRLHVDVRQCYARLIKVSERPDATRPARRQRSTRAPFDRRRYALLCVVAAELLTVPATTIGLLAARVTEATAADPEIPTFDAARKEQRAAYVDALKFLERHRMIRAVDGLTDSFVDSADVKVLYRVDPSRLLQLLVAPVPPSRVPTGNLDALVREQRYGEAADPAADVAEAQRNLWLRHSVTRRLLDDPVVYYADLTDEQRGYLATPTGRRLMRQAAEEAGFVLEERAEGLLLVDPDAIATDERFPEERSHAKHAALLLLDRLLSAEAAVAEADLVTYVTGLLERFPAWARTYQSDGGSARLVAEAVDVLCSFGLAARHGEGVRARPAAARYALQDEVAHDPATHHPAADDPAAHDPAAHDPATQYTPAAAPEVQATRAPETAPEEPVARDTHIRTAPDGDAP